MIHPTANVDPTATLGPGTRVWHHAQIREHAKLGQDCVVGTSAYIDHDVLIGDNVKIQNAALIFYRAEISDGVFIGPGACLTNDRQPRAITPDGTPKSVGDWDPGLIKIDYGASIGARAVVLTGTTIGRFGMVGAAAVVTDDVPEHGLVTGVPARLVGRVCACGRRLSRRDRGMYWCEGCRQLLELPDRDAD